jgi:ankyrin repeat protein
VRQFLQAGADVNFRDSKNKTAMDIAEEKGYAEIADILTKAGAR